MDTFFLHFHERDALAIAGSMRTASGTKLPEDWQGQVVIHWGGAQSEQPGKRALQPVKAILRARQPARRDELLGLHGIKTRASLGGQSGRIVFPYMYKVAVFHLQILAVYEKKERLLRSEQSVYDSTYKHLKPAYEEVQPELASRHVRRASRESVKAIYALGLDYGLVTVGILPNGHTLVLDVDPAPKLNERLTPLFAQAIDRYAAALGQELRRTERAVLGSDPEFLLLSPRGKVVSADRYLAREGAVGCDAIVLSGHRVILPLAELRPQPSADPRELARNLLSSMQLAARAIPDESLAWLSGGMPVSGFPLGGHIHFSRCWLNTHLLRALDNYLALPLMQIEGPTTRDRRPRYGFLGDFRRQPHGGFEYRTLPSWMESPLVARGTFALASLIADNYWLLQQQPLQKLDIQRAYYRGDKASLQQTVAELWKDLEKLEAYDVHAKVLDRLKLRIERMEPWNEREDIRKAWRIAPYHRKEAIKQ